MYFLSDYSYMLKVTNNILKIRYDVHSSILENDINAIIARVNNDFYKDFL